MAYIFFGIITTFLAVIGFIEILRCIVSGLYKTDETNSVTLIFPENSTSESTEYTLRSYAERLRWTKHPPSNKIICIRDGLNSEAAQICSLICSEYEFMKIMSINDFIKEFGKKIQM